MHAIEMLESRTLMSVSLAAWQIAGPLTMVTDAGGTILVDNNNGARFRLPAVKADGSVNLTGSDNADNITVERVTGIDAEDPNIMRIAYFDTPDTDHGPILPAALGDASSYQAIMDREKANLATHEQSLAQDNNQADRDHDTQAIDTSNRIIGTAQAAIDALSKPTQYIRYTVEGEYQIYVQVTDAMTAQSRIRIDGAGGNDQIAVSNNVPMKASLGGGSGADKITSGSKASMLYGGGGADRLFSRSRHGGTLDGGQGADRYYDRFGEVQIMARNDGDSVVVDNTPIAVSTAGTLGVTSSTGKSYYLILGENNVTNLLA